MDEVEGGWFEPPISNKKKTAFLFYPEPLTKIKKKKNEETDFQNHVQWRWDLLVPFQPPKKKTNEKETKMKESNPPPTDNGRRFFHSFASTTSVFVRSPSDGGLTQLKNTMARNVPFYRGGERFVGRRSPSKPFGYE